MTIFEMEYLGLATVDKRLSNPMLPWIIPQIRRAASSTKVRVGVDKSLLELRGGPTNLSHPLSLITRLAVFPKDVDGGYLLYALKDPEQPLLYCHLLAADDFQDLMDLMAAMKEQSNRVKTPTSLCPDISPSSSHFFEVLYIGRIKVSHKKVPDTFIDDALDKFKIFEKQKKGKENPDDIKLSNGITTKGKGSSTYASTETLKSSDLQSDRSLIENGRRRSGSLGTVVPLIKKPENLTKENLTPELNRTMVFHVGRSDLRLISPDRKQVLLHKYLKDITFSAQGVKHCGHFAFVCKELTGDNAHSYVGYVFKCQSPSVAENLVTAINQASSSDKRTSVVSCEACPMVWYHRLCTDLEAASPAAAREALNRRLESLPSEEQAVIRTKLEGGGGGGDSMEVSMMLLRAHCEAKQARHAHDTPEARHEFLTHYLGGGAIFMKAKRSLTTSFDNLLKRKGSRDDIGPSLSLPHNATLCKDLIETPTKRISETDSIDGGEDPGTPGSMMNNIFMKLGKTPSRTPQDEMKSRSWRHAIFNTVVTPSKAHPSENKKKPRDKNFYKDLWKKAINQQVLLIRMEKENAQLTARQEEATVKRIKVEYDEMGSSQTSCSEPWESLLKGDLCLSPDGIRQALKKGVAKTKRGEVWLYLSRLSCNDPPVDLSQFPNYNVPYVQLLKQLTSHQHAILIDLGRTFPNHPYYSSPLGPGQLSLFNLLKAYSLLDPGVGYCQGLSFAAGVLLLHMSEADAYELLKFLMFTRGLRERYLPEMTALQVCLYQLSRLLHDTHPDLYSHLDSLDIAPSLYAAPWILTFFSSQFSLGFVVRILDFVFGDSPDIVFKVALALLSLHKTQLLACDSFESVMEYLKVRLPQVSDAEFDIILNQVLSMDISRALTDYGVEYHVLEEMSSPRPEVKRIKELEEQVGGMNRQLQMARSNTNRLEESRSQYLQQLNQLEAQVKGLEASVATLGEYMSELAYCRADITLPNDVVRILARHNVAQGRRLRDLKPQFSASDIRPTRISECSEYDEGKSKDTEADSLKKNEKNKTGDESKISKPPVGVGRLLSEEERKALVQARQTALERSKTSPSDGANGSRIVRMASHPLDMGLVATSFEGTTRLKTIPSLRRADTAEVGCLRRADSTEPASLRIIEKTPSDPVSLKIQSTKERVARLFGHRTSGPNQGSCDKLFGRETQLLIRSQQAVLGGDQRPNLI